MFHTLMTSRLLRAALVADAAVSGGCGALQLAGGAALADALGLPAPLLQSTGLFLIGYAALLIALAVRTHLHAAWIALIVGGNVGWAVGCVSLWLLGAVAPGAWGTLWLGAQALATGVFAVWQLAGALASATLDAASRPGLRGA